MDAPVLVVLDQDGNPKFGLDIFQFVRTADGKEYFVPKTDGSTGQVFQYGARVDANDFPLGIHTPLALLVNGPEKLVPLIRTPKGSDTMRYHTDGFVHEGREWHVGIGTGGSLRQLDDGTLNMRVNIVKGAGRPGGGNAKRVITTRVAVGAS